MKSYYITTPIYYVNDNPHIGHAYTTLACDVLARFKRLDGYRVKFLTGTDEHGQKVEKAAAAAGMDPQAFVDKVSINFRALAEKMNFSFDDFIRTTEPRHYKAVADLWQRLIDRGHIILGKYAGWYSIRDEAFYAESEIVDGKAPTGAPVEWVEEPSYFFNLSQWQEPLLQFYADNPDFILPESRRNEVISFVKGGLRDLSVSRTSFSWGVPVPGDDKHIMYVWLDALTNYITAVGYPDEQASDYKEFWPCDVHMVGKDILRFHAVYWPAFLMAAGLTPPKRIFAHGWWTNEGQKISKSLGNAIDPLALIDAYGLDAVRYFLMREVSFGQDGDFSHRAMIQRTNSDLSNDYGNLVQRVTAMAYKNCNAQVPCPQDLTAVDRDLLDKAYGCVGDLRPLVDRQALNLMCDRLWALVGDANKYVDTTQPWALKKEDPARMETVLYVLLETIRVLGILTQPLMPDASNRILDYLGIAPGERSFDSLGKPLVSGVPLDQPVPIFPRYVEEAHDARR